MLCRLYIRSMACRKLRVLSKCGLEAASFAETITNLVSESNPTVLDAVYYPDGVKPIYLDDCRKFPKSEYYINLLYDII